MFLARGTFIDVFNNLKYTPRSSFLVDARPTHSGLEGSSQTISTEEIERNKVIEVAVITSEFWVYYVLYDQNFTSPTASLSRHVLLNILSCSFRNFSRTYTDCSSSQKEPPLRRVGGRLLPHSHYVRNHSPSKVPLEATWRSGKPCPVSCGGPAFWHGSAPTTEARGRPPLRFDDAVHPLIAMKFRCHLFMMLPAMATPVSGRTPPIGNSRPRIIFSLASSFRGVAFLT